MDGAHALALLGLTDSATLSDVASAFRAAAKRCHPDHGGDRHEFEALFAAYEFLRVSHRPVRVNPFLTLGTARVSSFDAYDSVPVRRRRTFADELRDALAA